MNIDNLTKTEIKTYLVDCLGYNYQEAYELLNDHGIDCLNEAQKKECIEFSK